MKTRTYRLGRGVCVFVPAALARKLAIKPGEAWEIRAYEEDGADLVLWRSTTR